MTDTVDLIALIRDLTDPDPCWFDHHGHCQAHGWTDPGECPHRRATRLLDCDPQPLYYTLRT